MKLLTFLGVAKYQDTVYVWQNQEYPAKFAPIASCQILKPDRLIVFLTEDAEEQVFPAFRAACQSDLTIQTIPVPMGKDSQELWQIFDQVSSAVQPGEEVAFDITHGLRSFPLIGLLSAAFLRAGLNVDLRAVLYGAYDVRDPSNRTPMFDLSPMLTLLEWAVAADRFNRTGDSRYISSLVLAQRKQLALAAKGDQVLLDEVGHLGNLARALSSISQALYLVRPHQVMQSAAGLSERAGKAQAALQRSASALPFSLLLDSITQAYLPLAQPDPAGTAIISTTLSIERRMIHWYAERELWMQAISLAREWLLSWVMYRMGQTCLTNLAARQRIENVLGAEASDFRKAKSSGLAFAPLFFDRLPQAETVLSVWPTITDVRNDIDHAGMRESPAEPKDLVDQIRRCLQILDTLSLT